jgi:hypothetical protein
MDAHLKQLKLKEEESIERASVIHYNITFEGKNRSLILSTVSLVCSQTIKFQSTFQDSDRLCDLLTFLRGKLKLKENESVALTHIKIKQKIKNDDNNDGEKEESKKTNCHRYRTLRRELKVMEWDEEELVDLGDNESETSSTTSSIEPWGLNPQLTLKEVQYFSNDHDCTVVFVTNEDLIFKFPPEISEPRTMPKGEMVKTLRERLTNRRRRMKKYK